jgi:cytochrome c556
LKRRLTAKSLLRNGATHAQSQRLTMALLAALVAFLFAFPLAAATTSSVVNARVDAMDRMAVVLKTFLSRNVGRAGQATLLKNAQILNTTAARILPLFPVGSGVGQTNARPEIWTNWPVFAAKATALQQQADLLAQAVEEGNIEKVTAQARVVSQACAACHQDFRNESN